MDDLTHPLISQGTEHARVVLHRRSLLMQLRDLRFELKLRAEQYVAECGTMLAFDGSTGIVTIWEDARGFACIRWLDTNDRRYDELNEVKHPDLGKALEAAKLLGLVVRWT